MDRSQHVAVMNLPVHEKILVLAEALALAILVMRLVLSGLARRYRYFFWFLVANLVQIAVPFLVSFQTNLYGYIFLATEAVMVCFYALILFELYSILLRDLTGIAKTAKKFTARALVLALVAALLAGSALPHPRGLMEQFFYVEAGIVLSLLLFIMLITVFLVYFPISLHRNALTYAIGYAVYFLSKAALLFLNNAASSAWLRACSTAALVVSTACLVFWAVYLNREGERRTVVVGHGWGGERTQLQVLERLQELNRTLSRTRGK